MFLFFPLRLKEAANKVATDFADTLPYEPAVGGHGLVQSAETPKVDEKKVEPKESVVDEKKVPPKESVVEEKVEPKESVETKTTVERKNPDETTKPHVADDEDSDDGGNQDESKDDAVWNPPVGHSSTEDETKKPTPEDGNDRTPVSKMQQNMVP